MTTSIPAGHFYNSNYNDTPELIVQDIQTGTILTGHDENLTKAELAAAEYRAHILASGLTTIPEHLRNKFKLIGIRFFHSEYGHRTYRHIHEIHLNGSIITSCSTTDLLENIPPLYKKTFPLPQNVPLASKKDWQETTLENQLRLQTWIYIFLSYGYYEALPFMSFHL